MSQPVKLSDSLVLDARLAGEIVERSIARQVEYWARLGRSVELLLEGEKALALCRRSANRPLSACLETVDTIEGWEHVAAVLRSQPFPHYEAHPTRRGLLMRIDEEGRRTAGRFVKREFKTSQRPRKRRK